MPTNEPDRADEPFGERLRRLRLERGLSQRQLSGPGVSYAYISRLEAGARRPSVKAIRVLARTLGVSPEYLETGRDLAAREDREIRITEAELELRLERNEQGAERTLHALLRESEADGDAVSATRCRAVLGLAAHRRADFQATIELLEPVVAAGGVSPLTHPDVYGTLGHAYSSSDQTSRAVELLERCLEEIEEREPEAAVTYTRFATYLSYALADVGDLAGARRVLADALDRLGDDVDPYSRIRLHWSQARLASAEGEPQTALHELRRAIALLEATEDTRQLGRAHVLYGEVLTLEGEPKAAAEHLARAERLLRDHADRDDLYWLRTEQARCAALLGDGEEAVARAEEALSLIGDEDPAERGAALWALGQGLQVSGRLDEAVEALETAVALLESQGRWREATQAARALATALRSLGRSDDAFRVLERAAGLAARAGTPRTRL